MTLSRRHVLSLLSGAMCTVAPAALAQGSGGLSAFQKLKQAEWADSFNAQTSPDKPVRGRLPVLAPTTIPAMENVQFLYQELVDRGGWVTVPTDKILRLGMRDQNVRALRKRLIATGDLRQTVGADDAFDTYVVDAVKRFQLRHGIPADGAVGPMTFDALNVPAEFRLHQLTTNIERIKAMGDPGQRYVMVNIPGAEIEVVEFGAVVTRHTAVVGKVDRQTPLLSSRIHEINFNPFWTVPKSIIRRDLIRLMQEDPEYLTKNRIRIYTEAGEELVPEQVNWSTDEATNYMFRQDPGDGNSLGYMKINFHNPHAVFLHDTPDRTLFGSDYRFESSGCVRVHNVRELVTWVLRDNGFTRAAVDQTVRSGERVDVAVANPPSLYTVYFTAWTTGDGIVHFRNDIYGYDSSSNAVALNQPEELIGSPLLQQ